ncbi:Uncharacterised protein [Bordetella pertussis]|nr:Uncharacterised protein [Bordetella pertussis]
MPEARAFFQAPSICPGQTSGVTSTSPRCSAASMGRVSPISIAVLQP